MERTRSAGFNYIDINFWDWGHSPESPFYNDEWLDWVKQIDEWGVSNGVTFHQAHAMVFDPFDESIESRRKADSAGRALTGAGILGIDWVVFHPVNIPDTDHDILLQKNVEWLRPFVELAAENNTGIAIENMNDYGKFNRYCCSADDLCELTDTLAMPNVGICWDIGHAHCQKSDQYSEITKTGHRLKVLHVQDNNGISDGHTAPYYGTVDWDVIKKALDDVSYKGEFTFEAHMLVRPVPDGCKDKAASLLYDIGEHICGI
ncbi:MAG: sugar phosphate isomerase/epimerase [Eubacteriales bacterium]|nr:sugar phosphate isomerase/epimerase [Eubacteriales bacterium]